MELLPGCQHVGGIVGEGRLRVTVTADCQCHRDSHQAAVLSLAVKSLQLEVGEVKVLVSCTHSQASTHRAV